MDLILTVPVAFRSLMERIGAASMEARMSEAVYDTTEGEFVDFATLEEWATIDKSKDARIEELEVKLAKAVEALASWKHYDESDEVDHVSLMLNYADAIEKTRTTLAELTGGKDE